VSRRGVTFDRRRLATIDLGTNTVRLLIAELGSRPPWTVLDEDQTVTRVGEGLAAGGRLGPQPMARTAAVVADYVGRARRAGADPIRIVATSAVREAANGLAFVAELAALTGVRVEVVSGAEEARLTVRGILAGLPAAPDPLLAFDVGGGSTEFMLARGRRLVGAASLPLGVVALAERYPFPTAVDWPRYRAMEAEILATLRRHLPADLAGAGTPVLVGTAGTVTTLAALDLGLRRYQAERVHGHRLGRAAIDTLARRLGALTVAERAALPCLEPGRADLIMAGVAIVTAALDVTGATAVLVSDWGLREGIMAETVEA
jgi:exopolyphosphatase/guanosine-5'-triphosphate,3'-diphosphate pyrophosphatase